MNTRIPDTEIPTSQVADTLARWWFHYDQGDFEELAGLLSPDVHFTCRTDTGRSPFEEFVRCDLHGPEETLAWNRDHRLHSPFPLRHNATNVHSAGQDGEATRFVSYLFVTKVVETRPYNVSSGIVTGSVVPGPGRPLLRSLHVALDTMESLGHLPEDRPTTRPDER